MKAADLFPLFVFLVWHLIIKSTCNQVSALRGACYSFGASSVSVPLFPVHPFLVIPSLKLCWKLNPVVLCLGSRIPVHEPTVAAQKVQMGLAQFFPFMKLLHTS